MMRSVRFCAQLKAKYAFHDIEQKSNAALYPLFFILFFNNGKIKFYCGHIEDRYKEDIIIQTVY